METKKCSCCLQVKELSLFSKDKSRKDGLKYECKECSVLKTRSWHSKNRDRRRALSAEWYRNNLGKAQAKKGRRRASKLQATPLWSDNEKIKVIYEYRQLCSIVLKQQYHVDHLVPLKGKTVCGLHTESNLCVITAAENLSKSNHSWPDMWETTV